MKFDQKNLTNPIVPFVFMTNTPNILNIEQLPSYQLMNSDQRWENNF